MATPSDNVTLSNEELMAFHLVDRRAYKQLAIDFKMDPAQSMQVVAAWIWLESAAFRDLVAKITDLPVYYVCEIAEETFSWLQCMGNYHTWEELERVDFRWLNHMGVVGAQNALKLLIICGDISLHAIDNIMQTICYRIFMDIYVEAMEVEFDNNSKSTIAGNAETSYSTSDPCFVPPPPRTTSVSPGERSLFATFSKRYRILEWELRGLFTTLYGDCVDYISMGQANRHRQAMFAQVVLRDMEAVYMVLDGETKVKFTVNGKHFWVRKFDPSRRTPTTSNYTRQRVAPGEGGLKGNS